MKTDVLIKLVNQSTEIGNLAVESTYMKVNLSWLTSFSNRFELIILLFFSYVCFSLINKNKNYCIY